MTWYRTSDQPLYVPMMAFFTDTHMHHSASIGRLICPGGHVAIKQIQSNPILCLNVLTHRGRDKMAAIFQTFSNAFPWIKIVVFWWQFYWNLYPREGPINNFPPLVQIMAWHQVTSHYLNQWWLILMTHLCCAQPHWVKLWILEWQDLLLRIGSFVYFFVSMIHGIDIFSFGVGYFFSHLGLDIMADNVAQKKFKCISFEFQLKLCWICFRGSNWREGIIDWDDGHHLIKKNADHYPRHNCYDGNGLYNVR